MQSASTLRVESNSRQWGGHGAAPGDKQQQRSRKLQALHDALKEGDLDQARFAFVSLVNFDPLITQDPLLAKIGAALQSSNLYTAQHFARELKAKGDVLVSRAPLAAHPIAIRTPRGHTLEDGIRHIDFNA
jgi:hypothetical protein